MKYVLAAAVMVSATCTAHAGDWLFTFTNLCSSSACLDLHGRFSGSDVDADGVIELEELGSLEIDGARFHPAWTSLPGDLPGSGATYSFNYTFGGALNFSASAIYYRLAITVDTGAAYTVVGPVPEADTYAWTPQTRQLISAVPEPASAPMLLLGLLSVAGALVSRRSTPLR